MNDIVRERILVVDDDPDILLILKDFLSREGYEVVSARNGIEALDQARLHRIDLIVMDIAMPKLNGADAMREIRRTRPKIPYIMITAFHDAPANFRVNEADCVFKPFDLQYLLRSIRAKMRSRNWIENETGREVDGNRIPVAD